MNEHHFDAEITLTGRVDGLDWNAAAAVLRERVYGAVRVRAEWNEPSGAPVRRVPMHVVDERANADARDAPAFVELFFHDVYLLLNLATPGSFSGVVSVTGGAYRVNELAFDARVFEYARASLGTLQLRDVAAWYDSLQTGTRQIATHGVTKALFLLLHLARGPEEDDMTVIRLAQSAAALGLSLEHLAAVRDAIASGTAPVLHPMADDALDPAIDDADLDYTELINQAAVQVIGKLQSLI